ncbi:EamA family transporter [Streptomyces xinghaiensis]|uniref:EamA family transporter n=3 Tax=Streptomyces TaxID=1883 RepID=A0A3R7EQT7_9ACTN|nr:EamA family transporter [Streptomyces xinghaiensis]RKM94368.1 EamA family transporter [Streptomyces xinghaiensis]RNC71968.1 EamA family transporter [Streptomyces xinghaiensis]
MRESTAPVLVLGSMLSIHFGLAVGKQLFDTVGPMGVVALRLGLAALLLLLLHRPALPRTRADILLVLAFGTAIAGMNLVYPALRYLPLGTASALQLIGPVTLALLASRRTADLALAALAGLGVWLFHLPGGAGLPLPGVLLALASGASMACYLLLSRQAGARSAGRAPLALAVAWSAVLTVPFGAAESGTALLGTRALTVGALVAVFATVLPYSLEMAALRRIPPRTVGVLQSLEPVSAGLAGAVLLSEHLVPVQWLALGCVGAASSGTVLRVRGRCRGRPADARLAGDIPAGRARAAPARTGPGGAARRAAGPVPPQSGTRAARGGAPGLRTRAGHPAGRAGPARGSAGAGHPGLLPHRLRGLPDDTVGAEDQEAVE